MTHKSTEGKKKIFEQVIVGKFFNADRGEINSVFVIKFEGNSKLNTNNIYKIKLESKAFLKNVSTFPEPDSKSLKSMTYDNLDKLEIINNEGLFIQGSTLIESKRNFNLFVRGLIIGAIISGIISIIINLINREEK